MGRQCCRHSFDRSANPNTADQREPEPKKPERPSLAPTVHKSVPQSELKVGGQSGPILREILP